VDYSAISAEALALVCFQGGDESAWREFIRRFNPLIVGVAFRVAQRWGQASPQVIDDLVQETYLKLCAERFHILEKFKSGHQDAVYGFIKVLTANLAQDHFKAAGAQKRDSSNTISSADHSDSAQGISAAEDPENTLERNLLIQQVGKCLEKTASGSNSNRDKRVFWLYYRVGLSANAIANLPSIELTTKGVESTILRLTRAVREQLVTAKTSKLNLDEKEKGMRRAESL